ncbi:MAG: substrate-binding domain-containing protein [Propionibacteriaceae bacterium]|nr:substrate-binding domain-containing protein [Propionibacteriaceae bacterium]
MQFKKLALAGLGFAMAAAMAACSTPAPAPSTTEAPATDTSTSAAPAAPDFTKVGIVLSDASQPRWKMAEAQFKTAMPGAQIMYSNNDTSVEAANVDSFIAQGVKVLIINSIDGAAAAAETDRAAAAGIPVIAYDRLIMNTKNVSYYVTFDSVQVGEAQGKYLADQAKASGQKGLNLYLFAGDVGDNNAFLFFQGAWSQLQPLIADGTFNVVNSPQATQLKDTASLSRDQESQIMGPITTLWKPDTAKTLAETALAGATKAQKGTVYLLAPNDQTSAAMTDAFRADKDVTTIYSTGQDLALASVQYILDGKQSMTVFKDDKFLVQECVSLVGSIFAGTPADTSVITTTYDNGTAQVPASAAEITVVTKDNVEQVANDSGLYTITNGQVAQK